MNFKKSFFGLVAALVLSTATYGITYTTIADGPWSSASTWDANGVPPTTINDDIIAIENNVTGMPNMVLENESYLIVNTSSTLTGANLTLNGSFFYNFNLSTLDDIYVDSYTTTVGPVMIVREGVVENTLGTLTINGDLTIDDGDYENGGTAMTIINGNIGVLVDGDFTNKPSAELRLRGDINTDGSISNVSTSEVYFDGSGDQSVSGSATYANLYHKVYVDKASGTLTLNDAIEINKDLHLTNGTFATSTLLTMGLNSQLERDAGIITGTIQGSGDYDVTYINGSKTTGDELSGAGLDDITISLTALQELTLSEDLNADGNITTTGGTIDVDGNDIFLKGNWVNSSDFSGGDAEIHFIGTSAQTISGSNHFNDLRINNSTGVTVATSTGDQYLEGTLTVSSGTFDVNGNEFTLVASASRVGRIAEIPPGADIVGDVTVQQIVSGPISGWHTISAAVVGATIADFSDDILMTGFTGSDYPTFPFNSILFYDETDPTANASMGFTGATNVTNDMDGKGVWTYISGLSSPNIIDTKGPINKGLQSIPVTYTNSGDATSDGWNLVPNPFPSQIDWDAATGWTRTNIAPTFYVWNPVTEVYDVFNHVTGVGTSSVIASSQSFWVQTTGTSPVLEMAESVKTDGLASFKNAVPVVKVRVDDPNDAFGDETIIVFAEDASPAYDTEYDAYKLASNTSQAPMVASVTDNTDELAINTLPFEQGETTVAIKAVVKTAGLHSITLSDDNSVLDGACLALEDLMTGDTYPVTLGTPIKFNADPANAYNGARFLLHISEPVNAAFEGPASIVEVGDVITFENLSQGADAYLWSFGDGNSSSDLHPEHTFESPGVYDVTLTVTGGFCQLQRVRSATIEVRSSNTVGVQEFNPLADVVGIFNNGSEAWIDFAFDRSTAVTINVLNTLGQEVVAEQTAVSNQRLTLNTNNLNHGVYIVNVTADNKTIAKKIKL